MGKILVTGASGELGSQTLKALLQITEANQLVAMVRDPSKVQALSAQGVEVRRGDYLDQSSLIAAFEGIEKVLMVSAVAFTDRLPQHLNIIQAAKYAGVSHLVYTSIQRKTGSVNLISMVTESDLATEQALVDSGLAYTIVRNSVYQDSVPYFLGAHWASNGVQVTAGDGRATLVSRADLAYANALILTQTGHEGKTYTLGASEAISFREIAAALSEVVGRKVLYQTVSKEVLAARLVGDGIPAPVADFLHEWIAAVNTGEFEEITGDLEHLIGRRPISCLEFIGSNYSAVNESL